MNSFQLLLEKLDDILKKYNLPNYKRLEAPLSEKEIKTYLDELNIHDEDFKSLFLWKNGYDVNHRIDQLCQVFDFGTLLSFDAIIGTVKANKNYSRWNNQLLIPLITDSTGQYILFNNKVGLNDSKLYLYSASLMFTEPISYYDSMSTMIATTIEAYEQEALEYDEAEDWLNIDMKKYHKIASKINEKSKYWTLQK